jgi:hypothetical protein
MGWLIEKSCRVGCEYAVGVLNGIFLSASVGFLTSFNSSQGNSCNKKKENRHQKGTGGKVCPRG